MNSPDLGPPGELVEFVTRVGRDLAPSHDRRNHKRYHFTVPATVQPLDEKFNPEGESFAAVTRDLSAAGIGLLHTQPVRSRHIEVTINLPSGSRSLTVQVLRCQEIGTFYDIGGSFVSRPVSAGE